MALMAELFTAAALATRRDDVHRSASSVISAPVSALHAASGVGTMVSHDTDPLDAETAIGFHAHDWWQPTSKLLRTRNSRGLSRSLNEDPVYRLPRTRKKEK